MRKVKPSQGVTDYGEVGAVVIFRLAPHSPLQERYPQSAEKTRPYQIDERGSLTELRPTRNLEWHVRAGMWRCGVGRECRLRHAWHLAHLFPNLVAIGQPTAPTRECVLFERNKDRDHIVRVIADRHMQKEDKTLDGRTRTHQ